TLLTICKHSARKRLIRGDTAPAVNVVREVRVGATPNGRNSAPLFLTSSWKRTSAEFPKGRCKSWTLWFQISIRPPKALANSGTDRLVRDTAVLPQSGGTGQCHPVATANHYCPRLGERSGNDHRAVYKG